MYRVAGFLKACVLVLAVGLMGQQSNCKDLNSLLPQIDKLFSQGTGGGASSKVYIANLSFMDAETRSVLIGGEALNDVVQNAMQNLAAADPKYVVNDPKNTLPNTDATARKLSDIFWDANLSRVQKVERIIAELMQPNNLDGLVSGQFHEKSDGTISVRPFVVSKSTKALVTESKTFQKTEFECKNAQGQREICQKAREDIADIVKRLIVQGI